MRARIAALALAAAGSLALPAAAHAGVVAAMFVRDEATANFDVTVFDPLDGSRTFPLPAGALTAGPETGPVLSGDGKILLFKRSTGTAGGPESLIMVRRDTGVVSTVTLPTDSFGVVRPFGLSPDGRTIITAVAGAGQTGTPPLFTAASARVLDSAALPAGPFPEVAAPVVDLPDSAGQPTYLTVARRGRPAVSNSRRYAWVVDADAAADFVTASEDFLITGIVGGQSRATRSPEEAVNNPVLTPGDQSTITFDNGRRLRQVRMTATPQFSALTLPNYTPGSGEQLTEPKWTQSGRYLAWISKPFNPAFTAVPVKVYVYDTETQGLVRADGRLLGSFKFAAELTVAETPSTISGFQLSTQVLSPAPSAISLNTSLVRATSVGILVQRVSGRTRLLGRSVPRLVTVGRVPLGPRRKGRNRIPWNGRVNGRRLPRGTYRITMRAIARDGKPADLSRPVTLRVR